MVDILRVLLKQFLKSSMEEFLRGIVLIEGYRRSFDAIFERFLEGVPEGLPGGISEGLTGGIPEQLLGAIPGREEFLRSF